MKPDAPIVKYPYKILQIGDCDVGVSIVMENKKSLRVKVGYKDTTALDMRISGEFLVFFHPEGSKELDSPKEGKKDTRSRVKDG